MALESIERHRKCPKCKKDCTESQFLATPSKFHPGGRSIYCIDCLERMVPADDLAAVDKLMQWLDWPFMVDQWTKFYKSAKERTLHLYAKMIDERRSSYNFNLDWQRMNEQWREEQDLGTLQDFLDGASKAFMMRMRRKWPSEVDRTIEDYHYLEDLYNDLLATQNLVTATQRDDAKRLCEVGLIINQKLRAGLDAKNEMAMYHNIIKAEGFEPKNSRNLGDFDSVGEIFTWLAKRGWKPKWHEEPQDSVDFTMKCMQDHLKRLVQNESSIGDQVENRRKQLELAERLERNNEISDNHEEEVLNSVEYEDHWEEDDDDDALN